MNRRRLIAALLGMTIASLPAAGGAGVKEKVVGKTYYTATNIRVTKKWYTTDWNERGRLIESTNFIHGRILPAGTAVTIKEVNDRESDDVVSGSVKPLLYIRFLAGDGAVYVMTFKKRHAAEGQTIWTLFEQYFAATDPLAPGGPFSSLTAFEQENVKKGTVAPGMSKKAVLMAYGYPPGHRTPSLDGDKWTYWANPFKTFAVVFENGVVAGAQEAAAGREPTAGERLRELDALRENGLITQEEHDRKRAEILEGL